MLSLSDTGIADSDKRSAWARVTGPAEERSQNPGMNQSDPASMSNIRRTQTTTARRRCTVSSLNECIDTLYGVAGARRFPTT